MKPSLRTIPPNLPCKAPLRSFPPALSNFANQQTSGRTLLILKRRRPPPRHENAWLTKWLHLLMWKAPSLQQADVDGAKLQMAMLLARGVQAHGAIYLTQKPLLVTQKPQAHATSYRDIAITMKRILKAKLEPPCHPKNTRARPASSQTRPRNRSTSMKLNEQKTYTDSL